MAKVPEDKQGSTRDGQGYRHVRENIVDFLSETKRLCSGAGDLCARRKPFSEVQDVAESERAASCERASGFVTRVQIVTMTTGSREPCNDGSAV